MDLPDQLLILLEKVPATFWGVIAGAFFATLGVVLTNRANMIRLQHQLEHERRLRHQERDFALRRDIYLGVAAALGKAQTVLGQMNALELTEMQIMEGLQDSTDALAKAHVVATEETAQAMSDYGVELTRSLDRLFPLRLKLKIQKMDMDSKMALVNMAQAEVTKWLEHMKQYNLEQRSDQVQWKYIQSQFKFEQERHTKLLAEHERMLPPYQRGIIDLASATSVELARVSACLIPVIVAVRKELGLPIDAERYGEILRKAAQSMQAANAVLLDELDKIQTAQ